MAVEPPPVGGHARPILEPAEHACDVPPRSRKAALVAPVSPFSPCHDSTFRDKHEISYLKPSVEPPTIVDTRRGPHRVLLARTNFVPSAGKRYGVRRQFTVAFSVFGAASRSKPSDPSSRLV